MIAGTYTQGGQLRVVDLRVPDIADDELLLRVEASAICGSDLKIIRHGHRKLRDGQTVTLGHEFVGTVQQAGSRVKDYPVGMRVGLVPNIGCGSCRMCRRGLGNMCPDYRAFGITFDGAHAECVRVPADAIAQGNVIPLPDDVSPVDASLIEPLSCAVNSIRAAQVAEGDMVLVYGAGPMGLLNALVARAAGAAGVLLSDLDEHRLRLAGQLGIDDTVNPRRSSVPQWAARKTEGRGLDAVIVAVPSAELQREGLGLLAPFGRLCLFAGLPRGHGGVELDTNAIHYRNLIVTGTTGGSARDYREALELVRTGRVEVARLVSHVFPFRDMQKAYNTALAGEGMKVVMVANPD
jgi:L-iditol 2-dehydrogenase